MLRLHFLFAGLLLGPASGDPAGRRLQADLTNVLPDAADLTFTLGNISLTGPLQALNVLAGETFASLRIASSASAFASSLGGLAALRVAPAGATPGNGGCTGLPGGRGFTSQALTLTVDGGDLVMSPTSGISFMLGGAYRLCYSSDGSFSGGTSSFLPVPFELRVQGARRSCGVDRCMEEFPWRCFVYPDTPAPSSSCTVRVDAMELVADTNTARLQFGPRAATVDGAILWACGADDGGNASARDLLPPAPIETASIAPALGSQGREYSLTALATTGAFSVQTCLCPHVDGADADATECSSAQEFVQPLGRAIFFQTQACTDIFCSSTYAQVLPSSPFLLRVDCGGLPLCSVSTGSRIKIIDQSPFGGNDLPSWSLSAGCRTAFQTSSHFRPLNCQASSASACGGSSGEFHGGTDPQFKVFAEIVLGPSFTSGVPTTQWFDVCYCDDGCDSTSTGDAFAASEFGFHKVGRVRVSPAQLIDAALGLEGVRAAGLPADVLVQGGSNIPVAPQPAQMKLIWDNSRTLSNERCGQLSGLVTFAGPTLGPSCSSEDQCSYRAAQVGSAVAFNDGGALGEKIRFDRAGVVAVCYCGVLADGTTSQAVGECFRTQERSYWVLAVRTLIRGPCALSQSGLCEEQQWSFPVGLPFRLELKGLGLRSTDKLRIIDSGGDCASSGDGGGEPTVFKGCPADCTPLDRPDTFLFGGGAGKDDVDIQIDSSAGHSCDAQNQNCRTSQVVEITTEPDRIVWRFDADPGLATGDVVVLENVSGGTDEENAIASGELGLEHIGHVVTRLSEGIAGAAGLLYSVPVTFGLGSPPRFSAGSGAWRRTSYAASQEELRATEVKSQLQVCWGSRPDTYHIRAGRVSFESALAMPGASLSLTTWEGGRPSPLLLSFTTSAGGATALKYRGSGTMRLRLRFRNVAWLEPRQADASASAFPATAPLDRNSFANSSLAVCGQLFSELWSDDSKGFPLPQGCYFTSAQGTERELNIIFAPLNGLETDSNYQLVFNGVVTDGTTSNNEVLSVWSMDDAVGDPYNVIEMGDARLARNPRPSSGIGEPRFAAARGLELLDGTGSFQDILELTANPASVLFKLRGDTESPITAGSILRLFFFPLTVWDLDPLCQALCFPHFSKQCGIITSCLSESVVSSGRRNIVKLVLPQDMSAISGASTQHTIRVSQLSLPVLGFFGTPLAGQVSLPDDTRVHFTESSGVFLWKAPRRTPSATAGSVVVTPGDGNQAPFRGQTNNVLYLRLLLGVSLFAELKDGDATMTVQIPPGYACLDAGAAPTTLRIFGSSVPQGRGDLPEVGTGGWSFGNGCTYSLRAGELIPAGSQVFVRVVVNQPDLPLALGDETNRWALALSSRGRYRLAVQTPPAAVFTAAGADLGAAVAAQGRLQQQSLQPSSFAASAQQTLSIFFQTEQATGYGGALIINAPRSFNVALSPPDLCLPSPLPEVYYRLENNQQTTAYLPVVESCVSSCTWLAGCEGLALSTARITLRNPLLPELVYGFQLSIQNSAGFDPEDETSWSISTADNLGRPLDASFPYAPLNPATGGTGVPRGWGIFQEQGVAAALSFSSLRPSSVTGTLSLLSLTLQVPSTFDASCRLIGPVGFNMEVSTFQGQATAVPGATASWSGGLPFQTQLLNPGAGDTYGDQPPNTMLWFPATYSSGLVYGFTVGVSVPRRATSTMLSAFLLQFGWDASELSTRPLSFVLPVGQVQSITNFEVDHLSNVVGARQRIYVTLETMSVVPIGGRLVLTPPPGFAFQELCTVLEIPGEAPLSGLGSIRCEAAAAVTLTPQLEALPTGFLHFALDIWNPDDPFSSRSGHSTACGSEKCWQVEIFSITGAPLDAPAFTSSFPINVEMPQAQLVDLTTPQRLAVGRNDRPGQTNRLIFAFRLASRPTSEASLRLRGPFGFAFDEDCLPGLSTVFSAGGVFGRLESPLPGFASWSTSAEVLSCAGRGPRATLQVSLGLREDKLYAFRVTVMNAAGRPDPNTWTLEFGLESSRQFGSFSPWTFSDISLSASSRATSDESNPVANPVEIRFRPHKEVGADSSGLGVGGLLYVVPATGLRPATRGAANSACEDFLLRDVIADQAFLVGSEVVCSAEVDGTGAGSLSFTLTGSRSLSPGRLYALVLQVINPYQLPALSTSTDWTVWTYSNPSGAAEAVLDRTTFPGFPLIPRLSTWKVTAPSVQSAGRTVSGVLFELSVPALVVAGSQLLIRAPEGVDITKPPTCSTQLGSVLGGSTTTIGRAESLQACALRVWQEVEEASAASWRTWDGVCSGHVDIGSLSICSTDDDCSDIIYEVCSLTTSRRECHGFAYRGAVSLSVIPSCAKRQLRLVLGQADSIPSERLWQFQLNVKNPTSNPSIQEQFWQAEVYEPSAGEPSFAASAEGWRIIPSLLATRVTLLGPLLATGSLSTLEVQFQSPSNANSIQLDVAAPADFDCRAASASDRVVTSATELSVTVAASILAGATLSPPLRLSSIRLGSPGPASFVVKIRQGETAVGEDLDVSDRFSFRVPQRISVESQALSPLAQDVADVRMSQSGAAAFAARTLRGAVASFTLRGLVAATGDALVVSAPPYGFPTSGAASLSRGEEAVSMSSMSNGTSLRITLQEALDGSTEYFLSLEVTTGSQVDNGERWSLLLWPADDGSEQVANNGLQLPQATNDAGSSSFRLAEVLSLRVSAGRVAPRSLAEVVLMVDWSAAESVRPESLILLAPTGFIFDLVNCLRDPLTVTSQVLACRRGDRTYSASLQIGGVASGQVETALVAEAPAQLSAEAAGNTWLARAMSGEVELAWGSSPGFGVTPMEEATINYGGVPSAVVHLFVHFRTAQTLMGGGYVEVITPDTYRASCLPEDGFAALFLPGLSSCDNRGGGVRLRINITLAPGSYAFMAGLLTPAFTPSRNGFDLLLTDLLGKVIDARVSIPGQRIVQGLNLEPLQLQFGTLVKGAETQVRIILRVASALEPLEALGPVRAIQIAAPEHFTLVVREPVLNLDGLPTPEIGWFHLFFLEKLIRVDLVSNAGAAPPQVPAGSYRIEFVVRLPEFFMPSGNAWLVSICRDLTCSDLAATLAVAGFDFDDTPTIQNQAAEDQPEEQQGGGGIRLRAHFLLFLLAHLAGQT